MMSLCICGALQVGYNVSEKLTPTFRLGFDLARLRVVVGEAVWDGRDRELV
jgi:hypothetical protein